MTAAGKFERPVNWNEDHSYADHACQPTRFLRRSIAPSGSSNAHYVWLRWFLVPYFALIHTA